MTDPENQSPPKTATSLLGSFVVNPLEPPLQPWWENPVTVLNVAFLQVENDESMQGLLAEKVAELAARKEKFAIQLREELKRNKKGRPTRPRTYVIFCLIRDLRSIIDKGTSPEGFTYADAERLVANALKTSPKTVSRTWERNKDREDWKD